MYYTVTDDYWVYGILVIDYYYILNDYQADDLIDVDEINLYYLSFMYFLFIYLSYRT
jgi:hypothetical protein